MPSFRVDVFIGCGFALNFKALDGCYRQKQYFIWTVLTKVTKNNGEVSLDVSPTGKASISQFVHKKCDELV